MVEVMLEDGSVGSVEIEYPKHDREDDLKSIGWTADYSTVGEISLKERYSFPDRNGEAQHHVGLDSKGNAKTFGYYYDTDYENNYEMCFEFGYTAENYLSEVDDKEVGYKENFYYENGCLAKYRASHKESSETLSFDAGKYFPNRCPNNSQIDGFGFLVQFGDGLPSNILRYFGLVGHTEKYMMECFPYGGSGFSDSPRPMSYPEPNKVIHTSYTTGKFADDNPEAEVNYKYDEDNCITDIVSTLSFSVIQVDYDIVVGNELLYPEMPEGGYKYEVKNRTEKKVKDDSITKTWKIIY